MSLEQTHSYPSATSRIIALVGLVLIWGNVAFYELNPEYANQVSPELLAAISLGLLALSKNFNIEVKFLDPRTETEKRFVQQLGLFKRYGMIGGAVSMLWAYLELSHGFVIAFILPFAIFAISFASLIYSTVRYRPFVVWLN